MTHPKDENAYSETSFLTSHAPSNGYVTAPSNGYVTAPSSAFKARLRGQLHKMGEPVLTASGSNMPTISEGDEMNGTMGGYDPMSGLRKSNSTTSIGSNPSLASNSTYSAFNRRHLNRNCELTVDRKWKVEDKITERLSEISSRPSRLIPLAKWLATIILGGSILTLFVATKLSFIALSRALGEVQPRKPISLETQDEWVKYTGQFLVIYMALSIPPVILLCRSVWMGMFTRQVPWPKGSSVFCCVLAGVLEPAGLIIFVLKVFPVYPPTVSVLLTGTVIAIPVLVATVKSFVDGDSVAWNIMHIVASLCVMAGLAGVALLLDMDKLSSDEWTVIYHTLAAVVALNIAWLPVLQNQMIKSSHVVEGVPRRNITASISTGMNTPDTIGSAAGSFSGAGSSDTGIGSGATGGRGAGEGVEPVPEQIMNNTGLLDRQVTVFKKATWKACIILYSVKLISIFVICFGIFYIDSGYTLDETFTDLMHKTFLKAWNFEESIENNYTWPVFAINLGGGFLCYALVFIVCHTNMQPGGLGLPLLFSLPVTILMVYLDKACVAVMNFSTFCNIGNNEIYYVLPTTALLTIGQIVAFGRHAFKKDKTYLQKEGEVFWIPGYQTAVIDSWLLLDRKHRKHNKLVQLESTTPKTRVYICTTMYREDESEMRQLLESLNRINMAQAEGNRFFESHIVFDGGVDKKNPSEFALILISLLEETLGIKPSQCTKITTPYGLKLSWMLPTTGMGKHHMTFNIHLKDNKLVKNKKRWSQVMYMSYVIDFLTEAADPDEESYILTTDADVMFTPSSVEALLDLMSRDNSIGAVCARTHPMGSGPLVWYQIFEYAVGHWFQKASEHVLGSVLCAPGCFSVYRCRSLADILPKYSKKVETAFDFLTKDMGEDRWLCTLLVQSGWRIEYCAASENSTNCPSEFEEFYKQRRRWIASTLANLMLIIKEWRYIALFNHRVSVIFLIYQSLLLFSTLIGPSTIVLVVSGGLVYAWNVNSVATLIIQIVLCTLYAFICILCSPKTHLRVGKIYTFLYAMIMCAVVVGTAEQIVSDLNYESNSLANNGTTTMGPPSNHISIDVPVSVTTIYFAFLACMFVLAGILHPRELPCLCHSLWYLLCLPSAYLVLMIYSICNLTDSSWGTRESTTNTTVMKRESWYQTFKRFFYNAFFCCTPPEHYLKGKSETKEVQTISSYTAAVSRHSSLAMNAPSDVEGGPSGFYPPRSASAMSIGDDDFKSGSEGANLELSANFHGDPHYEILHEWDEIEVEDVPIPVEDWLPQEFRRKYTKVFNRHGFDSTLFIKGLTDKDLNRLGITTRGHVQFLMAQITQLPAFEIEYKVPTNVNEWLHEIGLPMYKDSFRRNHIRTPREMEILKRFDRKDIEKELGISKEGHIKRLMYAIQMLRDPTDGQQKAIRMRQAVEETPIHYLREFNVAEFEFWKNLRSKCLEPDLKAFGLDAEIKLKLVELRNSWLIIMAVSNILWLILIITLASKSELTVLGANPLGLVFLFIFGFIFVIQFISMMIHRLSTLAHYLARAPYKFGKPLKTHWSFQDKNSNSFEDTEDVNAVRQIKRDAESALKRATIKSRKSTTNSTVNERSPLIAGENHNGAFLNHAHDFANA